MKNNLGKNEHNKLLEDIVSQLRASGEYGEIHTYLEYNIDGICGEVDILADHLSDSTYHFYEIKCTLTPGTLAKAVRQYQRYKIVHPDQKLKGWAITYNREVPL